MGSRKLSAELGISTAEAKEIIENYFKAFPTVKSLYWRYSKYGKREGLYWDYLKKKKIFWLW